MDLLTTTLLLSLLLLPAHHLYRIYRNYLLARTTGLPLVFSPFSPINPFWVLASVPVHQALTRLGLGRLARFAYYGWDFHEKATPFVEMDTTAFIVVSPGRNWLSLADADAVSAIFARERKGDFSRPVDGVKMLDVFGPNISTAAGADWQRMRRITAASFNEATNRVVWGETLRQGRQVLAHWLAAGGEGVRSTAKDTQTLALNVMLCAGFGKTYDFEGSASKTTKRAKTDGSMDYREALKLILDNAILMLGLGPGTLPKLGIASSKAATLATAWTTFRGYMAGALDESVKEGLAGGSRGNLLASLVRASVEEKTLSQDEVFGNMFVWTFGGHDTTAHSLAFTFLLLSVHPEVQAWMREEIREVFKSDDPDTWSYDDFGKLKRALAVQIETMRLYNPLLGIIKQTNPGHPVQLSLQDGKRETTIPGNTPIVISTNGLHTHPKYWGNDAREWRPARWIRRDDKGEEQLVVPPKGHFYPWSEGMRSCPGKKFAHAEHVALMATIFHDHEVGTVRPKGTTVQQEKVRVMGVVNAAKMGLTIRMAHPERASLVWKRCRGIGSSSIRG